MYVWAKPRPHTHTKYRMRSLPQYHISYTGSSVKELPPKASHSHKMQNEVSSLVPHFLHRVLSEGAPPPQGLTHTKCRMRSLPRSTTFPTQGPQWRSSPPRPPPQSLFRERCSIPKAPSIHLSKLPVDKPSSRFPKRGPYGKWCPSPEPFLHILQGPQQGSPPSRFSSQSTHTEGHSNSRAPLQELDYSYQLTNLFSIINFLYPSSTERKPWTRKYITHSVEWKRVYNVLKKLLRAQQSVRKYMNNCFF